MIELRTKAWLVLVCVAGCAVIDGLGDSGDDDVDPGPGQCNPEFPGCNGDACDSPHDLGPVPFAFEFDVCGFDHDKDFALGFCDSRAAGDDLVFRFQVPFAQDIELCTSSPTGSDDLFVAQECSEVVGAHVCLPTLAGGCVNEFLDAGDHFIYWQGAFAGECGFLYLEGRNVGAGTEGPGGPDCVDGADNNSDGLQDCEDPNCRIFSECSSNIAPTVTIEVCDQGNDDDGSVLGNNLVDEFACNCVSDAGCDDIDPNAPVPYVCHIGVSPSGPGMCNPPCSPPNIDWCPEVSATCDANGRCVAQ